MTLLTDEANADAISEALLGSATVVGADGALVVVGALVVTGATVVGAGVGAGTVVSGMVVSGSVVSGMVVSGTVVSITVTAGAVVSTACVSTGPVLEQAARERTMMVEIAAFLSRVFILYNVPTARLGARAGAFTGEYLEGFLVFESLARLSYLLRPWPGLLLP